MQPNNKQIAKNTFFLYLRMFITMAVSLYTVRVVLKVLTVQDYGLYGAVGGIILTFNFISSVLDNASQRFFAFELGKEKSGKLQETFSTIYIVYLIVSILIILLAETLGLWFLLNKMTIPVGRESAAMWVYQFALLAFLITIMATPFRAMIIAQEKMNLYAYLSIFDAVSKLLIVYLLVIFDFDKLKLYAVLLFIFQLIGNSIYFIYCRKKYSETRLTWKFSKKTFKSVSSYSSWTLFGTLTGICNTQGVNIVLNLFFGPVANAAYSIASQVYHTVGTFASNFYIAVKPPIIKNFASNNFEYVHKLFTFSSKTFFTLLCVIAIPLMVFAEDILQLWLGKVEMHMTIFVQLSLVYVVILTISYPITAIVQAGGNVKLYHTLVDGFTLTVLPIVYILFKMGFEAYWAYIVSIVIFLIAHALRIYVLRKVFPLFNIQQYVIGSMIPMSIIFTVSYFFMAYCRAFVVGNVFETICLFMSTSLFVLLFCVFFLYSSSERLMIVGLLKKRFSKN